MTVEEMIRRILRAHYAVISVCIAVPVLAVLVLQLRHAPEYVATVRIQVSSAAPNTTTQADALSSRVLALATTPDVVDKALTAAGVDGDARTIATHAVSARRMGESPIVELSTTTESAAGSRALAAALAQGVAEFMNQAGQKPFEERAAEVARQLSEATAERDKLARRLSARDAAAGSLTATSQAPGLEARLASAQSSVDGLSEAKAQLDLAQATRDRVVLVDDQHPTVVPVAPTLVPRLALAVLLGLLVGLTIAALLETLRPRMPGARALARRLEAPVLGSSKQRLPAQINAMTMGARRQGLETVVILGVDGDSQRTAAWLLRSIERADEGDPDQAKNLAVSYAATTQAEDPAGDPGAPGTPEDDLDPIPTTVRFSDLLSVSAAEERTAGVVVVTSPAPLQSDVEILEDLLRTMRWPVVGILATAHSNGSVRL